jgi:hypothetical protein
MTQDEEQKRAEAASYENETQLNRMVTIPLREYDKLKEEQHFIKDKALIDIIDNIERLVRALRKHIVRTDVE